MNLTEEIRNPVSDLAAASPDDETWAAPRWALGARATVLWGLAVLGFLLLCYRPLDPTELMAHLSYGDWLLQHRALPAADPIQPLAAGMPILDASWLAQAVLATVERAGDGAASHAGAGWLAALFALLRLAGAALLLSAFRRVSGSWAWGLVGLALVLAFAGGAGGPWETLGPATFGALCMAFLLRRIASFEADQQGPPTPGRGAFKELAAAAGWVVLFALWANLHVSFVLGLAVLALGAAGKGLEALSRRRERPSSAWRSLVIDRPFRRWLLFAELAAAATLINPYGIELWLHVWRLRSNPNLAGMPAWQPLSVEKAGGWAFALAIAVLLWAFLRGSSRRRPIPVAQALWGIGLGLAALAAAGLLAPCAPLFVLILLPQFAALLDDLTSGLRAEGAAGRFGRWASGARERFGFLAEPSWHKSVLALALLWAAFVLSPVGASLLRGEARPPERAFSASAPVALAGYLAAHPPRGLTFMPTVWADWLVRQGPQGRDRLRPFATTEIEGLPTEVWQDYLRIAGGASDWQRVLDRYGVRTAIFDREAQHGQIQSLRYAEDWRLAYEDDRSFVFERTAPTSTKGGKL